MNFLEIQFFDVFPRNSWRFNSLEILGLAQVQTIQWWLIWNLLEYFFFFSKQTTWYVQNTFYLFDFRCYFTNDRKAFQWWFFKFHLQFHVCLMFAWIVNFEKYLFLELHSAWSTSKSKSLKYASVTKYRKIGTISVSMFLFEWSFTAV